MGMYLDNIDSKINSHIVFHHFPSYEPPPNFVGSCAYVVEFSVSVNPGDLVVIGVAVAAQTLDRLVGHRHCTRGGVQQHSRTVCIRNPSCLVDCLRD